MPNNVAAERHVLLTVPSHLPVPTACDGEPGTPRQSWIQLVRTGQFQSARYGQFSITTDDLRQMLHNFRFITPKAPTELPIDFDHLSMSPQRPGDGKAAGWLKDLAIRGNGDELWGLVEWTPTAATLIRNREYRYVSPSFVRDYTYKDGRHIGTTLLAAAITNHPFLEGMQAVTLAGERTGDGTPSGVPALTLNADRVVGRHVSFLPNEEQTPELSLEERDATYVIKGVRDQEAFLKLATLSGKPFGWFPQSALGPAPSQQRRSPSRKSQSEVSSMSAVNQRAVTFLKRVTELANTYPARQAFALAQAEDRMGATAYMLVGDTSRSGKDAPVVSLTMEPGECFDQLVRRYACDRKVTLRQAIQAVSKARPDLVKSRG